MTQTVNLAEPVYFTESFVGYAIFGLTFLFCLAVLIFDSVQNGKFMFSKNMPRHLLDGLTFATGCVVGLAIFDKNLFNAVASNAIYITVTAGVCIFGPISNLAERYGRALDK